jgi:hypothetical protein
MLAVVAKLSAKTKTLLVKMKPYYSRFGNFGSWSHDSIRSWVKLLLHQPMIWNVYAKLALVIVTT